MSPTYPIGPDLGSGAFLLTTCAHTHLEPERRKAAFRDRKESRSWKVNGKVQNKKYI